MILPPLITDLPPLHQQCIYQTAKDYKVPIMALMSIWAVEGGETGKASRNKDGSFDYGAFQINTFWTNKFRDWFKINKEHIRDNFCMNVRAAGYILRYSINFKKGDFWEGVGMYHSMNKTKALNYKLKVKQASNIIYDYHKNPTKYKNKNTQYQKIPTSLKEKIGYSVLLK